MIWTLEYLYKYKVTCVYYFVHRVPTEESSGVWSMYVENSYHVHSVFYLRGLVRIIIYVSIFFICM